MRNGTAQLALDTIERKPTDGIPSWLIHPMEHSVIERLAGVEPGDYKREPVETYVAMQRAIGTCMIDQFIPDNPLTMAEAGYEEDTQKGATTGAHGIVLDGVEINSPEAVVEHMEQHVFPSLESEAARFDEETRVREILQQEAADQKTLGPGILKVPYAIATFPCFRYYDYGYENYFMAYALYPELMERDFSLQADLALRINRAVARAYGEGSLPPLCRLDHDMADSRGMLVNILSLEKIWFPHFTRCVEPLLRAGIRVIWHCDGNLMDMLPRLLDVGLRGFQGFQYEDGMDYPAICRMKTNTGDEPIIIAGVSVTQTLPFGTPDDVKNELARLVEHGPKTGLFLAASSSITPGVPWENVQTLVEGLQYYQNYTHNNR